MQQQPPKSTVTVLGTKALALSKPPPPTTNGTTPVSLLPQIIRMGDDQIPYTCESRVLERIREAEDAAKQTAKTELDAEKRKLAKEKERFDAKLVEYASASDTMKTNLDSATAALKDANAKLEAKAQTLKEMETQLEAKRQECLRLQTDLTVAKLNTTQAGSRITSAEQTLKETTSSLKTKQAECEQLRCTLQDREADIITMTAEHATALKKEQASHKAGLEVDKLKIANDQNAAIDKALADERQKAANDQSAAIEKAANDQKAAIARALAEDKLKLERGFQAAKEQLQALALEADKRADTAKQAQNAAEARVQDTEAEKAMEVMKTLDMAAEKAKADSRIQALELQLKELHAAKSKEEAFRGTVEAHSEAALLVIGESLSKYWKNTMVRPTMTVQLTTPPPPKTILPIPPIAMPQRPKPTSIAQQQPVFDLDFEPEPHNANPQTRYIMPTRPQNPPDNEADSILIGNDGKRAYRMSRETFKRFKNAAVLADGTEIVLDVMDFDPNGSVAGKSRMKDGTKGPKWDPAKVKVALAFIEKHRPKRWEGQAQYSLSFVNSSRRAERRTGQASSSTRPNDEGYGTPTRDESPDRPVRYPSRSNGKGKLARARRDEPEDEEDEEPEDEEDEEEGGDDDDDGSFINDGDMQYEEDESPFDDIEFEANAQDMADRAQQLADLGVTFDPVPTGGGDIRIGSTRTKSYTLRMDDIRAIIDSENPGIAARVILRAMEFDPMGSLSIDGTKVDTATGTESQLLYWSEDKVHLAAECIAYYRSERTTWKAARSELGREATRARNLAKKKRNEDSQKTQPECSTSAEGALIGAEKKRKRRLRRKGGEDSDTESQASKKPKTK